MNTRSGRARPLSADERRTAILDAVVPLLMENGAAVTTAEMADAAGIAEGTIFRVFPDKASLLHAAIERTLDPSPIKLQMDEIDLEASLQDCLEAAGEILARHHEGVVALVGMLRSVPHDDKPHAEAHRIAQDSMAAVAELLAGLLERHRDELRIEPTQAATLFRGWIFTNSHRLLSPKDSMSTRQLVDLLLGGIRTVEIT